MLRVTLGDRADTLADVLATRLSDVPPDPFAPEWVVVGSTGMRRWLSQYLSRRLGCAPGRSDGVTANIWFPFPSQLRRAITGPHGEGVVDPWSVDSLQFSVLAEAAAVGVPADLGRAHRIAQLFDRYHHRRHDMIDAWSGGSALDGAGGPLPERHRWQYELWRLVRDRIADHCDDPSAAAHPVARLTDALGILRDGATGTPPAGLPRRLFVVGLNHATPDLLDIVAALAVGRPVDVMWMSSSDEVTRAAIDLGRRDGLRPPADMVEPLATLARHPLAAAWGKAAREGAVLLGARTDPGTVDTAPAVEGTDNSPSTLRRLHSDVAADVPPSDAAGLPASITLHACAGAARQAEVARDAILHLLVDHPELTERDIAVICPDVERFAAPVRAAFGPPGEVVNYRIISRGTPLANERIDALLFALDLIGGRVTAGDLTALLASGAVRARFGFDHDDLATVGRWVDELAVRWGIDGDRREGFGVPASFDHNTWKRAVHSLMLGIALDPTDNVDPPPKAIEGSDVALSGRLAELIERLSRFDEEFAPAAPWAEWVDRLRRLDAGLLASPDGREWEAERLDARLSELARAAALADDDTPIELSDLRPWLREDLGGGPSSARLGDGSIVVCSPSVVRSVPVRAVVLMGLDQASAASRPADDLVAASPQLGDPEPRDELRQQLLDAVTAAADHLVVTFDAVHPSSAKDVSRATVLDELLDCLEDMGLLTERSGRTATDGCVISHPRLAVAEENFRPQDGRGIWSFDDVSLRGAVASRHDAVIDPLERARLSTIDVDHDPLVSLSNMVVAATNAPRAFGQQTLGLDRGPDDTEGDDDLVLSLGGLQTWELGQAVLDHRRSGSRDVEPSDLWSRRGRLPAGSAGDTIVDEVNVTVDALLEASGDVDDDHGDPPCAIDVPLGRDHRLLGSIDGVDHTGVLREVTYSRLSPKHLVTIWVRLLALCADEPTRHRAVVVGRHAKSKATGANTKVSAVHLAVRGIDAEERRAVALGGLEVLDGLFHQARVRPLPLFASTSYLIGRALTAPERDEEARWRKDARTAWLSFGGFGDSTDRWIRLFFGDLLFEDLTRDDESRRLATELVATIDDSVGLTGDHDLGGSP